MIYRAAGILGTDPRPLTLRKLFWMLDGWNEVKETEAKSQENALRSILAAIINTVAKKPIKPSELKFEEEREPKEMTEDDVLSLGVMMGVCNVV